MRSVSRVVDFAGDLMTPGQIAGLRLKDFGGTFVSPESGARGDDAKASWQYVPEAAEEERRVFGDDPLRDFISVADLDDRSDEFETDYIIDEKGDFVTFSVDLFAGPRANPLPKGMSLEQAIEKLLRFSPLYVIRLYEMAGSKGRLDILNMLPSIVTELVTEGVYTLQVFQQTSMGAFSAYRILKGHAAEERSVLGDNSGIACRMLKILQAGQMRVVA